MAYDLLTAYMMAIGASAIMGMLALHNRRSGWKRERNDLVLDSLMTWASARAPINVAQPAMTQDVREAEPPAQTSPALATQDLVALARQMAFRPGVRPAQPAVRTPEFAEGTPVTATDSRSS